MKKPQFRTYAEYREQRRRAEQFVVGDDDFRNLQIRPARNLENFTYFLDTTNDEIIKQFVLHETERTLVYCTVTLIAKGDIFEPRLHLKVDNTSKAQVARAKEAIAADLDNVFVKASVDLASCHENFWDLVSFLARVKEVKFPGTPLAIVEEDLATAVATLRELEKDEMLEALKAATRGKFTGKDVEMLVDRRAALSDFERLLTDDEFRDQRIAAAPGQGEEGMWQAFFEEQPWIFGYGLKLIACDAFDQDSLERVTVGADDLRAETGDRIDALLKTRGAIQSLVFVEMKTPSTSLLKRLQGSGKPDEYRSGVFLPSRELAGAVNQVQVTTHHAIRNLDDLHEARGKDGWSRGLVGTIRPRQVVVVGQLSEFQRSGDTNPQLYRSFELYRRSVKDVEIITFDELLARAKFIARRQDAEAAAAAD